MLVCFGLSWPINGYKSYKAGTAAGSSWQFIALITAGYVAGIAAKFASGTVNWVLAVYLVNLGVRRRQLGRVLPQPPSRRAETRRAPPPRLRALESPARLMRGAWFVAGVRPAAGTCGSRWDV